MTRTRRILATLAFAGASAVQAQAPAPMPCTDAFAKDVKCYGGRDANGAWYAIAIPQGWNRVVVVHPHDSVQLREPSLERAKDELAQWSLITRAGYALAVTAYRRTGYGVKSAAEDAESLRQAFAGAFAPVRRTLIHGQSWGANVAAKAIELYPASYDGALLTNGFLAGATRAHDPRVDLRVVFEFYCGKLASGAALTPAAARDQLERCTGWNLPVPGRSDAQRRNLADILAAARIPERALAVHLRWAAFVHRDIVEQRLGGKNPFSNEDVEYRGSHDDRALNAGVERLRPDREAWARFADDGDLGGRIAIPVITLHGAGDPVAFVENEAAYRATLERAGTTERLVQLFTSEAEHRDLSAPQYVAALDALVDWLDQRRKPSADDVAARCAKIAKSFDTNCRIDPKYSVKPFDSRVYPRTR